MCAVMQAQEIFVTARCGFRANGLSVFTPFEIQRDKHGSTRRDVVDDPGLTTVVVGGGIPVGFVGQRHFHGQVEAIGPALVVGGHEFCSKAVDVVGVAIIRRPDEPFMLRQPVGGREDTSRPRQLPSVRSVP